MKAYWLSIFFIIATHAVSGYFEYDFAAQAAQQEKWSDAQQVLSKMVVDAHDRPDVLYDTGVVSYQMGDFTQANAYFCKTAACEGLTDSLKEQAYFNSGNTYVALNELKSAIEQYEKVLDINQNNKYAKDNLERVKQMLEQQQQQQNQQDKSNKQNDQGQHDNNNSSGQDNQQEQSMEQDGGDQGQKDKRDGSEQQQSNGLPNESSQRDQQHESTAHGDQRKKEREQEKHADKTNDNEQGQDQHNSQDKSHDNQDNKKEDNLNDHKAPHGNQKSDRMPQSSKQDIDNHQKKQSIQDSWVAYVLQKQEEHDKKTNRRLMEAKIKAHCAGQDGQNCW